MALPSGVVWELRSAGSDTNGGGFVSGGSGTDWSQQTSPQYSVTDGVTIGTTTVTSATAAFGTDVVDNIANIGGSWFRIVSRTNATTIVVDRNTGTSTGVTIKIGGAFATVAQAYSVAVAGNYFYIKGALASVTAVLTLNISGSGNFLGFEGYTTTRGDNGQATWKTNTNSTDLVHTAAQGGYRFKNITFSNTAATRAIGFFNTGGNTMHDFFFDNCVFDGLSNAIQCDFAIGWQGQVMLFNCEVKNCTAEGIRTSGSLYLDSCYVHDNTNAGVRKTIGGDVCPLAVCVDCYFYNNGSDAGFWDSTDQTAQNIDHNAFTNCVFANNTGAGFKQGTTAGSTSNRTGFFKNCVFYGNSTYGIDFISATIGAIAKVLDCAFGSNTTAPIHNFSGDIGTVTLSSDPFNGRTTADISLNSTAGGGASLKAAGFPGVSRFGTGNRDIGAIQSGGGGVTTLPLTIQIQEPLWYS